MEKPFPVENVPRTSRSGGAVGGSAAAAESAREEQVEDKVLYQQSNIQTSMSACSPMGTDEELDESDDETKRIPPPPSIPTRAKQDELLVVVTGEDEKPKSAIFKLIKPSHHKSKVQEVQEEGKVAIDSSGSPTTPDLLPQDYILEDQEERSMIEPQSYEDPKVKELILVLMDWINDELATQRIIIKDLEEDLYDGQVLQKLMEKLTDEKLDAVEVTQNEEGQKQKLKIVLDIAQKWLGIERWSTLKWNPDAIHSKNLVSILHLLVALARHFRAPVRLPENVVINLVVVQKRDGILQTRRVPEEITTTYYDVGLRFERDEFDTLFDDTPDKMQIVKKSLVTFANAHLNKVNLEVKDVGTQFHDGVYLTLLIGILEGYFVPFHSFYVTPTTFDQKVHNVAFAFELMQDAGLARPKARPQDVVNEDPKSTLRVLYNLFTKYNQHFSSEADGSETCST